MVAASQVLEKYVCSSNIYRNSEKGLLARKYLPQLNFLKLTRGMAAIR